MSLQKSFSDIVAILPAAGIGKRMRSCLPKQYIIINGKTILEHSIDAVFHHSSIHEVIVSISPIDNWYNKLSISNNPKIHVVIGGDIRAKSVMSAVKYAKSFSWLLIHDAVRPCLHQDDLDKLISIVQYTNIGGLLAYPVRDTIKVSKVEESNVIKTLRRENLWHAVTPQIFSREILVNCLEKAINDGVMLTDEASALEYCGYSPILVPGRSDNIKVTYQEDLKLAQFLICCK